MKQVFFTGEMGTNLGTSVHWIENSGGWQMGKRSRAIRVRRSEDAAIPEEVTINGETYYQTAKAITVLGLTKDPNDSSDRSGGGKMLAHLMSSYKLELHLLPYAYNCYSYYVKKDDVDLARTLMESGIPFLQSADEVQVQCVNNIPDGWCGAEQVAELFHRVFPPR